MSEIAAEVVSNGQVGNEQPDPISSFSFNDIHDKAMSFGEEAPANTPDPAQSVQEQVPASEQPQEAQNVDNASQAQLAQLKDTDIVEVTVDGQPVQMAWKDAKGGVMRQAHYTREMQQLRQSEAQLNSQREQLAEIQKQHTALVTLLQDKNLLRHFLAQQHPDLVAAQNAVAEQQSQVDPNDIATVGQLQEYAQALEQRVAAITQTLEEGLAEREAAIASNIETRHATLKLANEINGTIKSLFDEHPNIVNVIPDAEQVLRYNVAKMQPKTPEEAVQAFKTVFGGWVEKYNSSVAESTKGKVVAKQKMLATNIQPPGGAGVQPQPTNFKKVNNITGKEELDWNKLHEAALAAL